MQSLMFLACFVRKLSKKNLWGVSSTPLGKGRVNPSGTKGFGTHTKHQGGGSKRIPRYLKNDKWHKVETLRGVRGIFQGLQKYQIEIIAFVFLPWQLINFLVFFAIR